MSDSVSVVRGNRPLRMLAIGVALLVVVAHFLGQINLLSDWVFWILLFMSANAIQASFTGFCPMFKNARGECVACGVACDTPQASTNKQGCCDSKDSNCCSDAKSNNNQSCCSDSGEASKDCCTDEQKAAGCCGDKAPAKADSYHILILGTGCANCTNTYKQVEKVTGALGLNVTLEKVEDVAEIAKYGVMTTPAVVINGQVVHSGGVPSNSMIEKWFGR